MCGQIALRPAAGRARPPRGRRPPAPAPRPAHRACQAPAPRLDRPPVAGVAQLVEHVIRNDGVGGSSPFTGTTHPPARTPSPARPRHAGPPSRSSLAPQPRRAVPSSRLRLHASGARRPVHRRVAPPHARAARTRSPPPRPLHRTGTRRPVRLHAPRARRLPHAVPQPGPPDARPPVPLGALGAPPDATLPGPAGAKGSGAGAFEAYFPFHPNRLGRCRSRRRRRAPRGAAAADARTTKRAAWTSSSSPPSSPRCSS